MSDGKVIIGIVDEGNSGSCLSCGCKTGTSLRSVNPEGSPIDSVGNPEYWLCSGCDEVLVSMRKNLSNREACLWIAHRANRNAALLHEASRLLEDEAK
jgi:hypothetical protein